MERFYYSAAIGEFAVAQDDTILGVLARGNEFDLTSNQRDAWKSEITIMKRVIRDLLLYEGQIIFEYTIPRLGKRIDVVLLTGGVVFAIEFKVGQNQILVNDKEQV